MLVISNKSKVFRGLHVKGDPIILYNVWNAGTAKIVAASGAKAIATGSASVAGAYGYPDGEKLPLKIALENLQNIVNAVDLPVSIDMESGYGAEPAQVANTAARAIDVGAVGFNLEDQIIGAGARYSIKEQSARIAASRKAADTGGVNAFVNARTDIFLQASSEDTMEGLLAEAVERAKAYQDAGADCLFVPKLVDRDAIETLCQLSPLPVNIMMLPNCPDKNILSKAGVARISYGPVPYLTAMQSITDLAKAAYS